MVKKAFRIVNNRSDLVLYVQSYILAVLICRRPGSVFHVTTKWYALPRNVLSLFSHLDVLNFCKSLLTRCFIFIASGLPGCRRASDWIDFSCLQHCYYLPLWLGLFLSFAKGFTRDFRTSFFLNEKILVPRKLFWKIIAIINNLIGYCYENKILHPKISCNLK